MRWLRLLSIAPIALLAMAFTGNGFSGCGTTGPATGGPLPVAAHGACFSDGDCLPMACEDRRCRSGECVVVADIRDGDADGVAPPPCGMDCDDTDARIVPGAAESCNQRDDDCDSFIDEDAPPGAVATLLGTADDRIVVAAVGDRMVLTDSGFSMGLRLRLADFAGTVGTAIPVTGVTPLASDLCSQGDSAILALVRDGTGGNFVIEAFPLVLSPTRALLVGAVMFSWTTLDRPVGVAVESFGSSFAFAWDAASGARLVMSPAWAAPFELPSAGGPLDLATDGTNLVVPSDFNALTFLRPDGTLLGLVPIPGQLADAPLASSSASVVVGYRDTFDHVLARVTSAGAGPGHTAPAVGAGFPLRVDDTPLGVLVTRFDTILPEVGVAAQLLRPTLDATIATFPAGAVSAGGTGTPTSFDVVASSSGTAILTSFGSAGSVLTVLGCEPR